MFSPHYCINNRSSHWEVGRDTTGYHVPCSCSGDSQGRPPPSVSLSRDIDFFFVSVERKGRLGQDQNETGEQQANQGKARPACPTPGHLLLDHHNDGVMASSIRLGLPASSISQGEAWLGGGCHMPSLGEEGLRAIPSLASAIHLLD